MIISILMWCLLEFLTEPWNHSNLKQLKTFLDLQSKSDRRSFGEAGAHLSISSSSEIHGNWCER